MSYLKWTKEAIYCFERGMLCNGCINEYFCKKYQKLNQKNRPPMKDIVLNLFTKIGKPILIKETKICPICKEEKKLEYFCKNGTYCKKCYNIYQKKWRLSKK